MPQIIGHDDLELSSTDADPTGDTLAIAVRIVDEPDDVPDTWRLQVDATVAGNLRVRVGEVAVTPSASLVAGSILRVVAGAYCPGVKRWHVRAVCDREAGPHVATSGVAVVELFASCDRAPDAVHRTWVWTIDADGADLLDQRADPQRPIVYGASLIVASRMLFASAWGTNEGVARRWVMLFDAAAVPTNGSVPLESAGADPGGPWRILAEETIPLRTGLVLVASSSAGVLTYDAAATLQMQRRTRTMQVV